MATKLIATVKKALGLALPAAGVTESATLIKITPGVRTTASGGVNPIATSYPFKGFVSNEKLEKVGGTLVEARDRIVCLLGGTVAPATSDKITIDGQTQNVVDLQGTPALWTCLCRG